MRVHYAGQHFREPLLNRFTVRSGLEYVCQLCPDYRCFEATHMTSHISREHDKLREVVPPNIMMQIFPKKRRMKTAAEKVKCCKTSSHQLI